MVGAASDDVRLSAVVEVTGERRVVNRRQVVATQLRERLADDTVTPEDIATDILQPFFRLLVFAVQYPYRINDQMEARAGVRQMHRSLLHGAGIRSIEVDRL